MPTYQYHCDSCQADPEIRQKMSDAPIAVCPNCQKKTLRRVIAKNVSIQFKGSGFYSTDYGQKPPSEPAPKKDSSKNNSPGPCNPSGCSCH